ncbi:MAG: hypothetical protein E7379_02365 [Clostridiales bacterium]|nr:hypothetical protein [Clostridiales bacterium]
MKIVILVMNFLLATGLLCQQTKISFADNFYWAKIEEDGCFFFTNATEKQPLFILPKSYFIKLIGEEGNYFLATYKDLTGYVKKEEVSPMDGTPTTPYFNETFRTFLPSGTNLFSLPAMSDDYILANIPFLYSDLIFYGSFYGDELVPDKGNCWYYCKYEYNDFGYVYSAFCDQLSTPTVNNERFNIIENISFQEIETDGLSDTAMTFIIVGVSLPCLIVLYLLMKPNMMKESPLQEKVKYKSRRRKDYFEFDQSDLN